MPKKSAPKEHQVSKLAQKEAFEIHENTEKLRLV